MRNYMNSKETNDYLLVKCVLTHTKENWTPKSDEEKKCKDDLIECGEKFCQTVTSSFDEKDVQKVAKRAQSFQFKLLDDPTLNTLMGKVENAALTATMPREQFFDWSEIMMDVTCKKCSKHWSGCSLHNIFFDNLVPESGCNKPNCKYAYDDYRESIKKSA